MPIPRSLRVAAVLIAAAALAGCTPSPTASTPASAPPAPSATASAPVAPELHPAGTAAENLPLFTAITRQVWESPERESGRAYIDALVSAGFEKSAMQVTNDRSTIGNAAESLQFAVRWGDDCLIGQVGGSIAEPVTAVVPGLATGTCLIGQTRPIDW